MKLNSERWKIIDAILDELLELPEDVRLDELRKHCAGDATLMADIARMLVECEADVGLLDQNALQLAHTLMDQLAPNTAAEPGTLKGLRVGAYTLAGEIGRGGMGVVYLANRTQGDYVHTAAIKVLTNVNVTAAERFRREQQALATLKHPNITQLLDAGVTEHGLPYLIMELIEGESITEYCARKALCLPARLLILDQVLEALAFAHKNLIVHRDIKPSNILITADGRVKLLDFSIAKLLDAGLALEETATHLHLLTPSYCAPEQVLNQPITVATDTYQLGLLYFRVLTGHRPLAKEAGSLHELMQAVCQTDVARPSLAMMHTNGLEETLPNIQEIRRGLSGDLDAILLKMLRKEPSARYPSIEALKADLHAYRHHLPVAARQAALGYHAGKYVRRNWRTIVLTGAACLTLLGYAASMQQQNSRVTAALARAELEQRKAEQVAQFLAQTFEAADPNKGGLMGTTAADLLEQARTKINEELKDSPEIQAPLLNIFSKIYFRQQDYKKAEEILANLLNNPKTTSSLDTALLAEAKVRLAQQKIGLGKYTEAEALLRQSLELQNSTVADNPLYGETLTFLGHILFTQTKHQEATQVTQTAIEYLSSLGTDGDRLRSFALNILANSQFLYDGLDIAITNMQEAVAIKQRILGDEHTETSNTQIGLARMLLDRENIEEATALVKEAYDNIRKQLPRSHPYHAAAIGTLAKLAQKQQRFEEALALITQSEFYSGDEKSSATKMHMDFYLVDILLDLERVAEARNIIAGLKTVTLGRQQDTNIIARLHILDAHANLISDNPQAALTDFDLARSILDADQIETIFANRSKAAALIMVKEFDEAGKLLSKVLSAQLKRYEPEHPQIQITCALLLKAASSSNTPSTEASICKTGSVSLADLYIPLYLKKAL